MRGVCSRNRLIMSPADYQIQYSAYRGRVLASAARGLYPTCGPSLHVIPPSLPLILFPATPSDWLHLLTLNNWNL